MYCAVKTVRTEHTWTHTLLYQWTSQGNYFNVLMLYCLVRWAPPLSPPSEVRRHWFQSLTKKKKKTKNRWEYPECDYHQKRKENTLQAWRNENERQETMLITCGNMDSNLTHFGSTVNGFLMKRSLCPRSSAILSSLILFQMFITLKWFHVFYLSPL